MKKRDIIFICAILLFSSLLLCIFAFVRSDGEYVIVRLNGETLGQYSLSSNGEYILNGGTNTLVIKQGKAFLKDCDCPDKLCEKRGEISRGGETITCLPNKLTVTVYSSKSGNAELVV